MSNDLINKPLHFYEAISKNEENWPALKPLWLVSFEMPDILDSAIMGGIRTKANQIGGYSMINAKRGYLGELENSGSAFGPSAAWDGIDSINQSIATAHDWLFRSGNLYAFNVMIPGDNYNVSRKQIDGNGRGEAAGLIGNGRGDFRALQIDFFETVMSFTESVLRPWLIFVADNSLKIESVKTTIHVALLGMKFGTNEIRKSYSFHGAFPQDIGAETYDQTNGILTRTVQFGYNWYSVQGWSA